MFLAQKIKIFKISFFFSCIFLATKPKKMTQIYKINRHAHKNLQNTSIQPDFLMLWSQTQKTQNSNPDFRPPCTPQTQKSTSEYNITTNPKINIHHKSTNPDQQNSQPTNPPSEYISPPRSTPLSWEIERWKSHLGLSLSGDEIMRLESLGSSRLHNH